MTADVSKSYLSYLNKLVDQCNNNHFVGKNPINDDYSALTEKLRQTPKFKFNDRARITKYKNILSNGYTENWSRKIFNIHSVLKINPWTCKIKKLNGEQIKETFYQKNCCWVNYKWVIIENHTFILEKNSKYY